MFFMLGTSLSLFPILFSDAGSPLILFPLYCAAQLAFVLGFSNRYVPEGQGEDARCVKKSGISFQENTHLILFLVCLVTVLTPKTLVSTVP